MNTVTCLYDGLKSGFVQIFGSETQDFFQTFFQNNTFFFQTRGYQNVINRNLKEAGTKLFSWCPANVQARLNKIWPIEKNCTHKAPSVAVKEKIKTIFPNFLSIFQTFSRSGKLLGKFQDFFKNSRLYTNPVKCKTHWGDVFFKLSADQLLALTNHRLNYFGCSTLLH